MKGRFQIRDTTTCLHAAEGRKEVTILDIILGIQAKGIADNYDDAMIQAWQKLKALQPPCPPNEESSTCEFV